MLPKARRFKTEDFKKMRKTQTLHAPHFFVRFCAVSPGTEKVAVIVSSGAYKRAVDRNVLRRRIYHLAATHRTLLFGKACTVTVKKEALRLSFKELEREFLEISKKISS